MKHIIKIEIENDKFWNALCANSALSGKPVSVLCLEDVHAMTRYAAQNIQKDSELYELLKDRYPEHLESILSVLD